MTHRSKYNAFLVAVLAGLPAAALLGWSSSTHAQYRTGGDGHALDHNNQVGSGGYNNNTSQQLNQNNINNNIVTGNVAGLDYFHGNTREFDPNTFQGTTASANSDRLNAIAGPTVNINGVHTEAPIGTNPGVTPYYSTSTFVGTPPGNFVTTPGGNGLVPAPRLDPLTPTDYDTRTDSSGLLNSNPATGNLLVPGELDVLGGPVDPSGNASIYSMSPLYGVRAMQSANSQDSFYQSRFGAVRTTAENPAAQQLNGSQIQKLRDELNSTQLPTEQSGQPDANKAVPGAGSLGQAPLSGAIGGSDQLPTGQALNSAVGSQQLNGDLKLGEGMQNQLLIPPSKQSAQLRELERRFAQSKTKPDDIEATKRFNEERKAAIQSDTGGVKPATPGQTQPGAGSPLETNPGGNGVTPLLKPKDNTPGAKPILNNGDTQSADNKPMIITSLATGIPAKGLADFLKNAEDKMRQGKYTEAVDLYESAQQVAPNNPFVYLGRSFAELGSSYYGKADLDFRRAVLVDPAVLAGRYDLNGFLGQDRVKFVQDELTKIEGSEKKSGRAPILLAFVAHNTGDDTTAASELDTAAARGGYAALVEQMRTAWIALKAAAK